ncbi:MAG: radical SAM protein [Candidatus Nitrospinota bacterium M3_3B_026]
MAYLPGYVALHNAGELQKRAEKLVAIMKRCELCARKCHVNRLKGELGVCRAPAELMVSSVFPHFGEEPELVGRYGSGTVFLTHCNLRCIFCQNYEISHLGQGSFISPEELADLMIGLQNRGCHNINFVTPTHYAARIVESLDIAAGMGLELPVVWNCGGYENVDVIRLLDGIVDIYMPDIKYSSREAAREYSAAPDYPKVVKDVVKEMHRQVGDLDVDFRGIARRGLLVRHLVMPNDAAGSEEIFRFLAEEVSKNTYVNIMDQWRPLYKAGRHERINRPITSAEHKAAVEAARRHGLSRGF